MLAAYPTPRVLALLFKAQCWYLSYLVARLTSPLRAKPTFILAGFMKCGSTFLASTLRASPDILGPTWLAGLEKETHHYSAIHPIFTKMPIRGFYPIMSRWTSAQVFDASVEYGVTPAAFDRITHDLPGVKLLFVVREQVSWFESIVNYYGHDMQYKTGLREVLTPEHLRRVDPEMLRSIWSIARQRRCCPDEAVAIGLPHATPAERELYSLVLSGSFHLWVGLAQEKFGKENVKVLHFVDVTRDTAATIGACRAFLGLPPSDATEPVQAARNASSKSFRVSPQTANALRAVFRETNEALREMTSLHLNSD
jgi:hypothetical protein